MDKHLEIVKKLRILLVLSLKLETWRLEKSFSWPETSTNLLASSSCSILKLTGNDTLAKFGAKIDNCSHFRGNP